MKILVMDTTTRNGSLAIADGPAVLAERQFLAERSVADLLPLLIRQSLDDAGLRMQDLEGVGVAVGPGSFTGLRVGVAAAKGIAYALRIPVAGYSSLAMLAMNFPSAAHPVLCLHDARKQEVYAGLYRVTDHPVLLAPEAAMAPVDLGRLVTEPTILAGDGAVVYADQLRRTLGELAILPDPSCHRSRGINGIPLALRVFGDGGGVGAEALLPRYLRLSEAELSRALQRAGGSDSG
jgi:tRNA threonylcarbamoyladenosine biosynthesis protein TsaB